MQETKPFTPIKTLPNQWERLILLLVLGVGAWLRFQNIGATELSFDQVYTTWQAFNTLDNGTFPLVGQNTSILFPNPPLTGYLFLPFLLLFRSHFMALVFVISLNTVAIWLVYRGLRWIVGTRPALLGMTLFATNPWVVEESRRTWVQSLLPFFITLIFWALVPILTNQTKHPARRLLIVLTAFAIVAHTYLFAYALAIPLGLLFLIFWKRLPKKSLFVGSAIFLSMMAMYVYGLYRNWDIIQYQINNFEFGQRRFTDEPISHAIRLITGWNFAISRGQAAPIQDWQQRQMYSDWLNIIWTSLIGLGILHALYRGIFDAEKRAISIILLIWFFYPIAILTYTSQPSHLHYQLLGVPAGYAILAWLLVPILKHRSGILFFSGLLIVTGGLNGLGTIRHAQDSRANPSAQYPAGLMLVDVMEMGDIINENRPTGEVVYSNINYWSIIISTGKIIPATPTNSSDFQLISANGSLYVYLEGPQVPPKNLLYAQKLDDEIKWEKGRRLSFWHATQDFEIPHQTDIPSDIGINFVGWEIVGNVQAGETIEILSFWHINQLFPERFGWTFSPYIHVLDGSGARVVNTNGHVISAFDLRENDLIIHRIKFTIPADSQAPYTIKTGYFDSVRLVNAIFRIPQPDSADLFTADIVLVEE